MTTETGKARRGRPGCWIAATVLAVLGLACLASLGLQSPTWRVARTRTVRASPERIRAVLSDVRAVAACCAPAGAGASAAPITFSDPSTGKGAWLSWGAPGERERGTIDSIGASRVTMRFDVAGRVSRQTIEWRAIGPGDTEVTWALAGDKSGPLQRVLWPVVGLQGRVGGSIERALEGLERAAAAP